MSKSLTIVLLTVSGLFWTLSGIAQQQPSPEMQQIYMEMVQASQQIQQLQQQAFAQSQELANQRDELIQMIDDRMVEIEPAVEALIEQRDELIATLQSATPDTPGEVMQQASGAYQSTLQELQAYQQQALGDSNIQSMQSQLQQAALEVMQEINPEIDAIIERFNEARTELMQMQQAQ